MVTKDGKPKFSTRQSLLDYFELGAHTNIILSGTDKDAPLERWWGNRNSVELLRAIAKLEIQLITTPNYSVFNDVPRHDNLYNIKRIAMAWSDIQSAGIQCALHLNARTDKDWERWIEFLNLYTEVSFISFEFGTGAGNRARISWYIDQLTSLARKVSRPLHLVIRGGVQELKELNSHFERVSLIDTSAFMRTKSRVRAVFNDGRLQLSPNPTEAGAYVDDLLDANIAAMQALAGHHVFGAKPTLLQRAM
jgi:hypothetical protein